MGDNGDICHNENNLIGIKHNEIIIHIHNNLYGISTFLEDEQLYFLTPLIYPL